MRQANQLENWAHIATILGPILVVCGGIWALYKFLNSKKEQVRQWKCEEKRNKQEKLTGIYNNLLRIISLFPNKTPNDIMNLLSYGPNFSSENFDTVNRILEIQIKEDYQKRLKREGLTYQDEEDIKIRPDSHGYAAHGFMCEQEDHHRRYKTALATTRTDREVD